MAMFWCFLYFFTILLQFILTCDEKSFGNRSVSNAKKINFWILSVKPSRWTLYHLCDLRIYWKWKALTWILCVFSLNIHFAKNTVPLLQNFYKHLKYANAITIPLQAHERVDWPAYVTTEKSEGNVIVLISLRIHVWWRYVIFFRQWQNQGHT